MLFGSDARWLRTDLKSGRRITDWAFKVAGVGGGLLMSRKRGCYKAKCTSCVSKVNYYSRDSHFLFVLVLISPHSWCVLPSGRPLIKPFPCRKLDDPSPGFLPSPPPTVAPTDSSCPIKQQTLSFYMLGCRSFMPFPAAVGWVNNVPKLEHFIENGFLPITLEKTTGWGDTIIPRLSGWQWITGSSINPWAVKVFSILIKLWIKQTQTETTWIWWI